jgi:hypothetical protein
VSVYPFDFVQYCVTDEPLVGITATTKTVTPGDGETYIGLYNFNPGFNGTIKTISFKTTVPWYNPNLAEINGSIYLKAKKYTDSDWKLLDSYAFDGETAASGEIDFSIILISGESALITSLNEVPLIIATSGYILSGQEEILGSELISNYDFSSGEVDWTLNNSDTVRNSIVNEQLRIQLINISPRPGAESTEFTVDNTNRFKLITDIDYHAGSPGSTLNYIISGETTSGTIAGPINYLNGTVVTQYINFSSSGDKKLKLQGEGNSFSTTIVNSISLKEVTQEGITVDDINIGRSHLVVRCLGETI